MGKVRPIDNSNFIVLNVLIINIIQKYIFFKVVKNNSEIVLNFII